MTHQWWKVNGCCSVFMLEMCVLPTLSWFCIFSENKFSCDHNSCVLHSQIRCVTAPHRSKWVLITHQKGRLQNNQRAGVHVSEGRNPMNHQVCCNHALGVPVPETLLAYNILLPHWQNGLFFSVLWLSSVQLSLFHGKHLHYDLFSLYFLCQISTARRLFRPLKCKTTFSIPVVPDPDQT